MDNCLHIDLIEFCYAFYNAPKTLYISFQEQIEMWGFQYKEPSQNKHDAWGYQNDKKQVIFPSVEEIVKYAEHCLW